LQGRFGRILEFLIIYSKSTNRISALILRPCVVGLLGVCVYVPAVNAASIRANAFVWSQFSVQERLALLAKFPEIELVPVIAVGTIQSAQVVNRSTPASHNGAALGSVVGQAAYVDHALKGSGSGYSAMTQVGAALLGAAIGSSLDSPGRTNFLLSYGVRTADGQVREVRAESAEEITKPLGQCVYLADLTEAAPGLCAADKVTFLKQLSTADVASVNGEVSAQDQRTRSVACRVPSAGSMTLSLESCEELHGTIEK
jgi:hypothetical protein